MVYWQKDLGSGVYIYEYIYMYIACYMYAIYKDVPHHSTIELNL